jgi:disulfide bond formation protein DsbB
MPTTARLAEVAALLVLLGSAALLGGALFFQYALDIRPCPLCHWQRYPHILVIVLAGAALAIHRRAAAGVLLLLAGLALLATVGLAGFHVGVEQKWWAGTAACQGNFEGPPMTVEEMMKGLSRKPPPRCDEIAWSFLGISMAGWNLLLSLALAGIAFAGAARRLGGRA